MKEIMSDSKTKTYFIVISAKNLIYDYLVVIVVPYKEAKILLSSSLSAWHLMGGVCHVL